MRDYQSLFSDAVQYFWSKRSLGAVDVPVDFAGRRSEVVAGKHLDGFLLALTDLLVSEGVDRRHIYQANSAIPGFFRVCKDWDLVVIRDRQLLAAIEFKAQVGPSFGNNFNNRAEEALGNAVDLWTAYREELFLDGPQPFVGYVFLLEDTEKSTRPVRADEAHFKVDPVFRGASYAKRYEILTRRLVAERHYSAATLLLTKQADAMKRPNYTEPSEDLSTQRFSEMLIRSVKPL